VSRERASVAESSAPIIKLITFEWNLESLSTAIESTHESTARNFLIATEEALMRGDRVIVSRLGEPPILLADATKGELGCEVPGCPYVSAELVEPPKPRRVGGPALVPQRACILHKARVGRALRNMATL
jgi:hypothetical protein